MGSTIFGARNYKPKAAAQKPAETPDKEPSVGTTLAAQQEVDSRREDHVNAMANLAI